MLQYNGFLDFFAIFLFALEKGDANNLKSLKPECLISQKIPKLQFPFILKQTSISIRSVFSINTPYCLHIDKIITQFTLPYFSNNHMLI